MARILIRRGPLLAPTEDVLGNADERRKGAVVECVRERVTGIEGRILARSLVHLQCSAVINGIPGQIVATDQTGRVARNAAVVILARRILRRRRTCRWTRIRPA